MEENTLALSETQVPRDPFRIQPQGDLADSSLVIQNDQGIWFRSGARFDLIGVTHNDEDFVSGRRDQTDVLRPNVAIEKVLLAVAVEGQVVLAVMTPDERATFAGDGRHLQIQREIRGTYELPGFGTQTATLTSSGVVDRETGAVEVYLDALRHEETTDRQGVTVVGYTLEAYV